MGCVGSRNISLTVQQQQSLQIDKQIAIERKVKKLKFLLLGSSESGKTTLFRQMRILHQNGFCLSERMYYKDIILDNIMEYTEAVLQNMSTLGIAFEDEHSKTCANKLLTNIRTSQNIYDFQTQWKKIYQSKEFNECMDRGQEYCLGDGAQHLFKSFERIISPDYVPTDQDILFSRIVTTGITEINFNFKRNNLCMVDVGGQRSERRKWIHFFDGVTAVIFTTALSFYDQTMDDPNKTNKLFESLLLFRSLCKSQHLSKSTFVLFLNKRDVFEISIERKSIRCCFPDYRGDNSFDESSQYIYEQFEKAGGRTSKMYSHFTTATDTSSFNRIFDTTMDILLNQNLSMTGLL